MRLTIAPGIVAFACFALLSGPASRAAAACR